MSETMRWLLTPAARLALLPTPSLQPSPGALEGLTHLCHLLAFFGHKAHISAGSAGVRRTPGPRRDLGALEHAQATFRDSGRLRRTIAPSPCQAWPWLLVLHLPLPFLLTQRYPQFPQCTVRTAPHTRSPGQDAPHPHRATPVHPPRVRVTVPLAGASCLCFSGVRITLL